MAQEESQHVAKQNKNLLLISFSQVFKRNLIAFYFVDISHCLNV